MKPIYGRPGTNSKPKQEIKIVRHGKEVTVSIRSMENDDSKPFVVRVNALELLTAIGEALLSK
jgi:hypothetical protein